MLPSSLVSMLPYRALGTWPTPLEPMDHLREVLGGQKRCPRLWIKREDLTGLAGGGNKVRKLEGIMGHALSVGADTVINTGGVQSNQIRQTAGAAARLGLECHLLLARQPDLITPVYEETGNIFVCRMLGAHIHFVDHGTDRNAAMNELSQELQRQGRSPYVIPVGASSREGVLGSARCGEELYEQAASMGFHPNWIAVTVGSAGTCAGLYAGVHAMGEARGAMARPVRFLGVDVLGDGHKDAPEVRLQAHITEGCDVLGITAPAQGVRRNDSLKKLPLPQGLCGPLLDVVGSFAGPGYARPYPEMVQAMLLVARTEGIILDPIYTGKTMAAVLRGIEQGLFAPDEHVVFVHSGGQYALFAYPHLFDGEKGAQ